MGVFQYLTAVVGVYGVEDALKGAVDKSRWDYSYISFIPNTQNGLL